MLAYVNVCITSNSWETSRG